MTNQPHRNTLQIIQFCGDKHTMSQKMVSYGGSKCWQRQMFNKTKGTWKNKV